MDFYIFPLYRLNYINTRRELEHILLYRVRMLCYNPRNMGNLESIWQEAAEHLESSLPDAKKQWIRRISYSGDRDGTLVLSLSSPFYRSTTEKNCRIDIENMVSEIAGHDIPVEFIVDPSRKAPRTERKAERKAGSCPCRGSLFKARRPFFPEIDRSSLVFQAFFTKQSPRFGFELVKYGLRMCGTLSALGESGK